MLLWIAFAAMTAVATLAALVPLARARRAANAAGHDVEVYRDQLGELDRDRERGLIGEEEAVAARTEIARRLLKASETAGGDEGRERSNRRLGAAFALFIVPATALGIYGLIGRPDMPDMPLATRTDKPIEVPAELASIITRVEEHLAKDPSDVQGWRVIAPVYARIGRMEEAANAYRRVVTLDRPDAEILENFGEVLLQMSRGIVTPEAQAAFNQAVALNPERTKARYYRAMGFAQAGRFADAVADYDQIIRTSPADAPWMASTLDLRLKALTDGGLDTSKPAPKALAAVGNSADAPGPSADDLAAAASMSEVERLEMIEGMVSRLAERLQSEPRDRDGWTRLIRAYAVLGRRDEARTALQTALATFEDDPDTRAVLTRVATDAGVETN